MDLQKLVGKNQTIKVLPPIQETLRLIGLNVDLDSDAQIWLSQLKRAWETWKRSDTVKQHIEAFFQSRNDYYHVVLAAIIQCDEYKDCKSKTLPYYIMEILFKWSTHNQVDPDNSVKLPAFHVGSKQRNRQFLNLTIETYKLTTIKGDILPIVKNIISDGDYKHASNLIIGLDLFDSLPTEDLVLPLILTDKIYIIDEYIIECPAQLSNFLQYLDSLLNREVNNRDYVQEYVMKNSIKDVKYEKLHYKPLGKLVGRLCNRFKVPIESCKNLSKNRTTAGLRYLIHQKYQENSVSQSAWDDLVKDSLKQYPGSANEFINILLGYDRNEAMKWAKYLNMKVKDYPPGLENTSESQSTDDNGTWFSAETPQQYYKLSHNCIEIVDSGEKFHDMITSGLCKSKLVGIDCEWKPSFGAKQSQVALIQVAISNKVFLIDTIVLNNKQYLSYWQSFSKNLLMNDEIIKIGFGMENDLKELKAYVVGLNNIKIKGEGLLDLCCLWTILTESGLEIPNKFDLSGCSLTTIVQLCFGLPLCKSEQCSNWELRPLRSSQIEYAALDACVLLEIFEYLRNLCYDQNINFDEICNNIMEGKPKVLKKGSKDKSKKFTPAIAVDKIRLLVEPQVSGLMAYLRYLGIDTIVAPAHLLWNEFINLAISDDRFVLVSKMKYTPYGNYPQSSILQVKVGHIKTVLDKVINYFNIDIKEQFILSRCIYCNDTDLKKMTPIEIVNLDGSNISSTNYSNVGPYYEELDYNKFLSDSEDDDELYQPAPSTMNYKPAPKTSKGVDINLSNFDELKASNKPATLCNSCGRLLWEKEEYITHIENLIPDLSTLAINT